MVKQMRKVAVLGHYDYSTNTVDVFFSMSAICSVFINPRALRQYFWRFYLFTRHTLFVSTTLTRLDDCDVPIISVSQQQQQRTHAEKLLSSVYAYSLNLR